MAGTEFSVHEADFQAIYAAVSMLAEQTKPKKRAALLRALMEPQMTACTSIPSVARASACLKEAAARVVRIHCLAGEGDYCAMEQV